MKAAEIRQLSTEELRTKLSSEKDALAKVKLTHVVSELENPMQIRTKRRFIAQLSTELTSREQNSNA